MRCSGLLLLVHILLLGMSLSRVGFASPKQLAVDHERSFIVAVTHSAGLLGFLGHEHGIRVEEWSAQIDFDATAPGSSSVAITSPVRALEIDSHAARVKAGLDPEGPSQADVQKIQQKMLGPRFFAADTYPTIEFRTTAIARQGQDRWVLTGPLTIRGIPHTVSVPVTLNRTTCHWYTLRRERSGLSCRAPRSICL